MDIPVQQFPILTPGQMNGFNQALPAALESYGNIVNAAYLRPKLQSDIAYKSALATYSPYNYLSKAISDPAVFGMMSDDQKQKVLNMMSNIPTNPLQSIQNGQGSSPSPLTQVWNSISGNSAQPNPQQMGNQGAGGQQTPVNPSQTVPQSGGTTSGSSLTQPNVQPSNIDLSDPSMNAYNRDFGSPDANRGMAIKYPSPQQKIALARNESTARAEGATGTKIGLNEMNLLQKEATADSQSAFNLNLNANKFKEAYDAAYVKGGWANLPGGERIAQFDPNAREAMTAATNAAVDMASKLFGTKQSDYREKLAQQLKFSITMPKKTVDDVFAGVQAEATRAQEHSDFVQTASDLGINNPNKIRNLWYDYNRDRPFYDTKKRQPITENLGSFNDYLNQRIQGKKAPAPQNNTTSAKEPIVEHEGKIYVLRNGKWMLQ